ncbi:hypothetical protein [Streptomyces griseosporeus]|uniref:hypothetical protein n=1 Tax=Streptomyces griseosporeus TaxID=1910 RepID=UPI0036968778
MRRRTARVLSVALLSGAAVAAAAPPGVADPAADVGPASVQPGGTVTVSVSCDAAGGTAPETLEATSQAFDEGTVELRKVPGEGAAGAAYRGTALIAPAEEFEDVDGTGPDTAWTVDGTCPAASGGQGKPWSATFDVARDAAHHGSAPPVPEPPPEPVAPPEHVSPLVPPPPPPPSPCPSPHAASCGAAALPHGVRAGEGGSFTDSVPALVAGGLLIAGAAGAAVHRLRQRDTTRHG